MLGIQRSLCMDGAGVERLWRQSPLTMTNDLSQHHVHVAFPLSESHHIVSLAMDRINCIDFWLSPFWYRTETGNETADKYGHLVIVHSFKEDDDFLCDNILFDFFFATDIQTDKLSGNRVGSMTSNL